MITVNQLIAMLQEHADGGGGEDSIRIGHRVPATGIVGSEIEAIVAGHAPEKGAVYLLAGNPDEKLPRDVYDR